MTMHFLMIIPLSFLMGFVNAISGGGGVFGVPAMLAMGLPPVNALALNRISDFGYLIGSLRNYMRLPEFQWKLALAITPPSCLEQRRVHCWLQILILKHST